MCEPIAEPICIFTLVGEFLLVNKVYQGCIVTFLLRDTIVNLILLDMVNDVILVWTGSHLIMPFSISMQRL